jgi:HSP20 family protein
LREEIDRLFESPLAEMTSGSQQLLSGWLPAVDVQEDNDSFYVYAELPGMSKENIDISLHDGTLSICGERKQDKRYENAEMLRSERFLGRFQRTFSLPAPVNAGKVKATYTDGILRVTLPKAEEAKPKQIQVSVS